MKEKINANISQKKANDGMIIFTPTVGSNVSEIAENRISSGVLIEHNEQVFFEANATSEKTLVEKLLSREKEISVLNTTINALKSQSTAHLEENTQLKIQLNTVQEGLKAMSSNYQDIYNELIDCIKHKDILIYENFRLSEQLKNARTTNEELYLDLQKAIEENISLKKKEA